jgi:hypothetical protein
MRNFLPSYSRIISNLAFFIQIFKKYMRIIAFSINFRHLFLKISIFPIFPAAVVCEAVPPTIWRLPVAAWDGRRPSTIVSMS